MECHHESNASLCSQQFCSVVGSALEQALSTVQGCIKGTKGGVGAFGVLAVVFMLLSTLY